MSKRNKLTAPAPDPSDTTRLTEAQSSIQMDRISAPASDESATWQDAEEPPLAPSRIAETSLDKDIGSAMSAMETSVARSKTPSPTKTPPKKDARASDDIGSAMSAMEASVARSKTPSPTKTPPKDVVGLDEVKLESAPDEAVVMRNDTAAAANLYDDDEGGVAVLSTPRTRKKRVTINDDGDAVITNAKFKEGVRFVLERIYTVLLLFVVPFFILVCILLRINFQSVIHLLLLFLMPFLYPITELSIDRGIRKFLIMLIVVCSFSLAGQLTFQVILLSNPPYGNTDFLPNCTTKTDLLDQFGFSRLDLAPVYDILRVILPDFLLLIVSICTYLLGKKINSLNKKKRDEAFAAQMEMMEQCEPANRTALNNDSPPHLDDQVGPAEVEPKTKKQRKRHSHDNKNNRISNQTTARLNFQLQRFHQFILPVILELIFLCSLLTVATMWPSLLSLPYFLSFIVYLTRWSLVRDFGTKFKLALRAVLLVYAACHILTHYLYQMETFQSMLPGDLLVTRLLGFNTIIYMNCNFPAHYFFAEGLKWQQITYPFALLTFYWFLAIEFSYFRKVATPGPSAAGASLSDEALTIHIGKNKNKGDFSHVVDGITVLPNEQQYNNADGDFNYRDPSTEKETQSNFSVKTAESALPLGKYARFVDEMVENNLEASTSCDDFSRHRPKQKRLFVENKEGDVVYRDTSGGQPPPNEYGLRRGLSMFTHRRHTVVFLKQTRTYFNSIVKFIHKQSFLFSLLSMMAWSILYHSLLTLVLLIWACIVWTLPKSRKWCLRTSPFLVFYAICLLCLEFIYGLQLNKDELPEFVEVGLLRHDIPFVHLVIKTGLLLTYWLSFKQYLAERRKRTFLLGQSVEDRITLDSESPSMTGGVQTRVVHWIHLILVKYWIFLSSGMLLLMSCQNDVVAYRIGYMLLFIYFITAFQLCNAFWRLTLYMFYLFVILYSMVVLLLIYTFQFDKVPDYFKNILHIDDEVLSSIGFERFDSNTLVLRLLTPCTFLIINILQMHYFHRPWMKLTDKTLSEPEEPVRRPVESTPAPTPACAHPDPNNDKENAAKRKTLRKEKFLNFALRMTLKANFIYSKMSVHLWRIAELHIYKAIVATIAIVCLVQVNLANLLWFTAVLLSLLVDGQKANQKRVRAAFCGLYQIWISVMAFASMTYQLKFIKNQDLLVTNCTEEFVNRTASVDPFLLENQNNFKYIGLVKSVDIQENLKYYILIFVLLTFQKVIKEKMKYTRYVNKQKVPVYSFIFEKVTWKQLDLDIWHFSKYMANFFFHRLGLEICFLMSAIVVCVRMDAYAIVYGIWLGLFLRMSRKTIRRVWPFYFIFLGIILPIQYITCLGLPPVLCFEYPWSRQNQADPYNLYNKIRKWLFLSDYSDPPPAYRLVADFFQFFFAWLQFAVFQLETDGERAVSNAAARAAAAADETATDAVLAPEDPFIIDDIAGSNNELVYEHETYKNNPFHDFVSEYRSHLDQIKYFVFMYSYWAVLAMVYLTGTSRISILCMGYVILSFFFLWYGQTFLMKPVEKLLKLWNVLVFYCFMVIFIKACLQIVLCLLTMRIEKKTICIIVDIFGIDCRSISAVGTNKPINCSKDDNGTEKDDVSLFWDVFCFIVLVIQRRMFMSYMFEHVVNEYRAQSTLAARGAGIFKEIIHNKVMVERAREVKMLKKLKNNVEHIRKKQSKFTTQKPTQHFETLRSGDYYMFDSECELGETDLSDSDNELLKQQKKANRKRSTSKSKKDTLAPKKVEAPKKNGVNEEVERSGKPTVLKEMEDIGHIDAAEKSWLQVENKMLLRLHKFLEKILFIAVDYITEFLNSHSKDFRHVSHILSKEKLILKKKYGNTSSIHLAGMLKAKITASSTVTSDIVDSAAAVEAPTPLPPDVQHDEPAVASDGEETSLPPNVPLSVALDAHDNLQTIIETSADVDADMESQSRSSQLLSSIFYFMLSQSEMLCYFFIILNHLTSASLLSAPLPISVFLWAMLTIPRPTKTFWITVITYIEAVVVIKYLFQFKIFPWNDNSNPLEDYTAIKIIGIDRKESNFALFDLFVLLVIFIHRTILKRLGLWKDAVVDDELVLRNEDDDEKKTSGDGVPALSPTMSNYTIENHQNNMLTSVTYEKTEDPLEVPQDVAVVERKRRPTRERQMTLESDFEDTDYEDDEDYNVDAPPDLKTRIRNKTAKAQQYKVVNPFMKFYNDMNTKHYAVVVDCFAKIFMCDFINCLITIFSYQYFGESAKQASRGSSDAISSIRDNKVPKSFLIIFLVQFALMIIDRALYLRKNRRGKFIFQFILVFFVHIWVFFILPSVTGLSFSENKASQLWYFVKCVYFGFSSRQIRCGYPTRILGNFLTKSYNYMNLILFKGFLLIPFLLELRSLMDWMFTDTSLGLTDWLQMEDIYANIFVLKCARYNENKYPTPRGAKRKAIIKYGFGGVLLTAIILIIWFPLLLFSFSEGFNRSIPPISATVDVQLGGFLPIYGMTSQRRLVVPFTKAEYETFGKNAPEDAFTFLKSFTYEDVYCISIPGNSTSLWQISPPSIENLKELLNDSADLSLDFSYSLTRESSEEQNEQLSEVTSGSRQTFLGNDTKPSILKLLNDTTGKPLPVPLSKVYPRFIHARAKGNIEEISSLVESTKFRYYSDMLLSLRNDANNLWWDIYDNNKNDSYQLPCGTGPGYLSIMVFSDKVSPSSLSFITNQGIIGIYGTFIMLIAGFVRDMMVGSSSKIMFEELPNVDKIWQLLQDILIVRGQGLLDLEDKLYEKLVYIYRDPALLIFLTKDVDPSESKATRSRSRLNTDNNNERPPPPHQLQITN